MVTSIEGQIRAVAVAREEQRCLDLEAETGKPVTRREVPPPWRRPGPCALLQDPDWLQYVTEFDYKLTNKAFQKYCKERGVLHVAGVPGSRRWEYYLDHSKTHDLFMSDPFFRCAEPHDGKRYQFSPDELATQWRIVGLGRAALQDAWELYRAEIGDNRKKPAAKREPKKAKPKRATKNTRQEGGREQGPGEEAERPARSLRWCPAQPPKGPQMTDSVRNGVVRAVGSAHGRVVGAAALAARMATVLPVSRRAGCGVERSDAADEARLTSEPISPSCC